MIPVLVLGALLCVPGVVRSAPSCSAAVSGGLAFGTYDVYSPDPLVATARLRLRCPKGLTPQITISSGHSERFLWREMQSSSDHLRYNVYTDAAMKIVWGDGSDDSSVYTSATGNAQLTLYARVPASQDVAAEDDYSDTLVITVFL